MDNKPNPIVIVIVVVVIIAAYVGSACIKTIDAGHVGVATLFGEVQTDTYREGLHFVHPLYKWHVYDVRQKTHSETATVPTQDQMNTQVDVSIQYRLIPNQVASMLQTTGLLEDVVNVHLVPKLRSVLREQGKRVKRAEDFFLEATQTSLQTSLLEALQTFMTPKGMEIQNVLIRDIRLPEFIVRAIQEKKEREQAGEKQKAELARFKTEQEQLFARAHAERKAAEEEAKMKRILADARAYEIEKINAAIANNPAYIQLQALEALKAISKDGNSKIYFLNSDSPMPLPLMHMGEMTK